ncbi:Rv3235 family protein [Pengzhenrongella sicca]|uniref:Energy transducer TonB n=1 Tax=Pengzhenrongella sicca TaxID=2819238 RepID=A0A8A4ZIE1_9MICO|nr:Rv3235 family protein [Pengzhenrongella sicca]QTE30287.1 energy transducer TonB [Pengzhenrongella sicca]
MTAPTVTADDAADSPSPVRARLVPTGAPPAQLLAPAGPPLAVAPAPSPVRELAGGLGADAPGRPRRPSLAGADGPLPDPTALCCAVVQAAVEALRGTRPLAQLCRWVSPEIYEQLEIRSELTRRVLGVGSHRATIRRIRLFRLGEGAAEATVVVDDGPRVRAVAIRLEGHRGQWRATALEIG